MSSLHTTAFRVHLGSVDSASSKKNYPSTPDSNGSRNMEQNKKVGKTKRDGHRTPNAPKLISNIKKRPALFVIDTDCESTSDDEFVLIDPKQMKHPPGLFTSPSLQFLKKSVLRPRRPLALARRRPRRDISDSFNVGSLTERKMVSLGNSTAGFQTPVPFILRSTQQVRVNDLDTSPKHISHNRKCTLSASNFFKVDQETSKATSHALRNLEKDDEFVLVPPQALAGQHCPSHRSMGHRPKLYPRIPVQSSLSVT
mmetsp:Transcript_6469/g.9570  ORF Transcript_6469/g.9570 Transcript_6469/m.9570 type:complete len:255 (-) Transcript_6469:541-1305(-)